MSHTPDSVSFASWKEELIRATVWLLREGWEIRVDFV